MVRRCAHMQQCSPAIIGRVAGEKFKRVAGQAIRYVIGKVGAIADVLSAEVLLKFYPNGSTIILLRTCWIATLLYSLALLLHSLSYTTWPAPFDAAQLREDIGDTVPWLGGIAGGVYAALYARFSAQWSYLAEVYHQIKDAQVAIGKPNKEQKAQVDFWQAAFVEDAEDLHLVRKKMFAATAWIWLQDANVARTFHQSTVRGRNRLRDLLGTLEETIRREDPDFPFEAWQRSNSLDNDEELKVNGEQSATADGAKQKSAPSE